MVLYCKPNTKEAAAGQIEMLKNAYGAIGLINWSQTTLHLSAHNVDADGFCRPWASVSRSFQAHIDELEKIERALTLRDHSSGVQEAVEALEKLSPAERASALKLVRD